MHKRTWEAANVPDHSAKDVQVEEDVLKLTDCCGGKVVFHKGEYVCSSCGISMKQRNKEISK